MAGSVGRLLGVVILVLLGCTALFYAGAKLGKKNARRPALMTKIKELTGTFLKSDPEFMKKHPELIETLHHSNVTDFDAERIPRPLLDRLRAAVLAEESRPLSPLTPDRAERAQVGTKEMHEATVAVLTALRASFAESGHTKLLKGLQLAVEASASIADALEAILPVAAGRTAGMTAAIPVQKQSTKVSVSVQKRPFGMHVKTGTTRVAEVFPGFPAEKAGVRKGCEVESVAGKPIASGTWLEIFQKAKLPFNLELSCGTQGAPTGVVGPISEYNGKITVMVDQKPFGMNVQVHKQPRVVEVLAGYPAERAGVRRGFVVVEVNDVPVDGQNWFKAYQGAKLPFTMTFKMDAPLSEGNPFFAKELARRNELPESDTETRKLPWPGAGYTDFRCSVTKLPFGMHVSAAPGKRPTVTSVLPDFPAYKEGIRAGDILVEVAGRSVGEERWFSAMQQASTPYGLLFRRPAGGA